jgi:phage replication initiation protein
MSAVPKSSLVLDGNAIKLRLEAERASTGNVVHVDWLRFTVIRRNAPAVRLDDLFPPKGSMVECWSNDLEFEVRRRRLMRILQEMPDPDFAASAQAKALAEDVCDALGPDFVIEPELKKGFDFYRFRWSITRNSKEVAWVGFLSSSESPRQQKQSETIHANITGAGCTFAAPGYRDRFANLIDSTEAKITRCDLALDLFQGIAGGMDRVLKDYLDGLMNVRGHQPAYANNGDWANSFGRSVYIGSKEAGKQTNIYEKGHQLYGREAPSPWVRIELRYGNKLRVLPSDMLRRPDDFFKGASDWHNAIYNEYFETQHAVPEGVPVMQPAAVETVKAEVARAITWFRRVAGPTASLLYQHLGFEQMFELLNDKRLPGRLQHFTQQDVVTTVQQAYSHVTGAGASGRPAVALC